MIKTTPLFSLCILPFFSMGQVANVHHFSIAGVPDQHAIKYAHQVVLDIDPQAKLSFDADHLKVKSEASSLSLLNALNSTGTTTYALDNRGDRSAPRSGSPFPVRVDTGDPANDDARYQTAKEAWIAANPAAYQQMRSANLQATQEAIIEH